MDENSIKNLLKEARDAIDGKEFTTAIELCKNILKNNRDNYMALVLMGAAMQGINGQRENASKAYKKAIQIDPERIFAWQGLATYYEKYSQDELDQLYNCYKKLLYLESNIPKWCSLFKKFASVALKLGCVESFLECVEQFKQTDFPEKREVIWPQVLNVLKTVDTLNDSQIKLLSEGLDTDIVKKFLFNKFYEMKKLDTIIEYAKNYDYVYGKEMACRLFGELSVIEADNIFGRYETDVATFCEIILQTENAVNSSAVVAKAVLLMKNSDFPAARDLLEPYVVTPNASWHAHCLLSKAYLFLLCYEDAEISALVARKCIPDKVELKNIIDRLLADAYARSDDSDKWNSAVEICKRLLAEDKNNLALALECMCRVYIKLENWDLAKKILSKLEEVSSADEVSTMLLQLQLSKLADNMVPPIEILMAITVKHPNSPEAWYQLGMQCLQEDEIQEGMSALFKAGRLAPHWYKVYYELGNYYINHDIEKARCCYKKALYLNKRCSEVAMALSDIYRSQEQHDLNLELLEAITKSTRSKWAWLRLGLYRFQMEDINAAVKCFLAAIRMDINDSVCWELLGDAYLARKAFTAAQKSYQKVVDLKPDLVYPKLQIARIKLLTEDASEVIPIFRQLAEENPIKIPVLKGLAEACLRNARDCHNRRLLGCARDYLQEAMDALVSAIKEWKSLSCLWKLLGDVFHYVGSLPPSWSYMDVPSWFDPTKRDHPQETILYKSQLTFFKFSTLCYSQALKLLERLGNASFLWYDLAASYVCQAKLNSNSDQKRELMMKAFAATKKSVSLNPSNHDNWNLLGIIAKSNEINQKPLAQHCFIKSVMNEEKNVVAWTNLGILYLELGEKYLANQALGSAQRIDETYVQCWIGQSLIAEGSNHIDTLDLFRHTTQLGFHPESGSGYAQHVLTTMETDPSQMKDKQFYEDNIVKMNAVAVASDAMTWYTEEREDDPFGLNMLGCLQEKSGLYSSAAKSFEQGLKMTPLTSEEADALLTNLGRVYILMKNYKDAIDCLGRVRESNFRVQSYIGLAYYNDGMYKEALNHFNLVAHYYCSGNNEDPEKKADLLIAKAAVIYQSAESRKDFYDAKTLLLECIVSKPSSLRGLYAAFAFGILKEDYVLSNLVLKELAPHQDSRTSIYHISLFNAYLKFIQGDLLGSVKSFERSVHRQPWQASLWLGMALMMLEKIYTTLDEDNSSEHEKFIRQLKTYADAAARSAYASMRIGRNSMDVTKILPVVSVCHMLNGDVKRSLSVSQHAVHLFPQIAEGWATLVLPAMHVSGSVYTPKIASAHLAFARENLKMESALTRWMNNAEKRLQEVAS